MNIKDLFTDNGGETGRRVHFTQNRQNRLYALMIRCDTLPKQLWTTIDKCKFKHKKSSVVHTVLYNCSQFVVF